VAENQVVVVGSINIDVVARAPHHPAVGETVLGTDLKLVPGGKGANQAVAAARLGARTRLVGRVGSDGFGDTLLAFLAGEGVDVSSVGRDPGAPSGTALIVVGDGDNTIVVVPGANAALTAEDVATAAMGRGDVVVAQYEIPLPVVGAALRRAKSAGALTVLNPAPALASPADLLDLADVVVMNETEEAVLGGQLPTRADQVLVVTLGARGAVARIGAATIEVEGRPVDVVDSTGAGDCFVGALATALGRGDGVADALAFANAAAALSVQQFGAGTGMPTAAMMAAAWPPSP
jgi:ribokinase